MRIPPRHIVKLYNYAYDAAKVNPYSWLFTLFHLELEHSGMPEALDSLNSDIAAYIIGG